MTSKEHPTATITTPNSTPGQSGRFGSERVAAFRRNQWPLSSECAGAEASDNSVIGTKIVHTAMDRLLELSKRIYWASWREHLDRNFTEPDRGHLYAILETVARDENGADRNLLLGNFNRVDQSLSEVELRNLIDTLLSDGYLTHGNDGRYIFRMNLLREWWRRYVIL